MALIERRADDVAYLSFARLAENRQSCGWIEVDLEGLGTLCYKVRAGGVAVL